MSIDQSDQKNTLIFQCFFFSNSNENIDIYMLEVDKKISNITYIKCQTLSKLNSNIG